MKHILSAMEGWHLVHIVMGFSLAKVDSTKLMDRLFLATLFIKME